MEIQKRSKAAAATKEEFAAAAPRPVPTARELLAVVVAGLATLWPGQGAAATAAPGTGESAAAAGSSSSSAAGPGVASVAEEEEEEAWDGETSPNDLELFNLLASLNNGGAKLPHFVHKKNVHSAAPADLFKKHQPHARGTGHGKEDSCYFYCDAPPLISVSKKGKERRDRTVVVSGGIWRPESCKTIIGANESVVAEKRKLSYMAHTCRGRVRTGWDMLEISLPPMKREDGVSQMVLCVVYQSNRKNPETSTAASSSGGAETPSIEPDRRDESLGSHGDRMQSPSKAAEKAMSCSDINERGLHRSVMLDTSHELEGRPEQAVKNKELTSTERNEDIYSSSRAHQGFSAQEARTDVNIHDQVSPIVSKAMDLSCVVRDTDGKQCGQALYSASLVDNALFIEDGADSELPIPVNSSSSGVKRKADQDHPETPASTRQERADTDPIAPGNTDRTPFSKNNPMPVQDGNRGDSDASVFEVQHEQHGLAEAAEGSSILDTALNKIHDVLFSEDPMEAGGDTDWDPDGFWARLLEGTSLSP